eukprot:362118-Chlamydomonas_euryale.AAC.1
MPSSPHRPAESHAGGFRSCCCCVIWLTGGMDGRLDVCAPRCRLATPRPPRPLVPRQRRREQRRVARAADVAAAAGAARLPARRGRRKKMRGDAFVSGVAEETSQPLRLLPLICVRAPTSHCCAASSLPLTPLAPPPQR